MLIIYIVTVLLLVLVAGLLWCLVYLKSESDESIYERVD